MPLINVAVDSSSLSALAYDDLHAILAVAFRDGSSYCYHGVPPWLFQELLEATSKGTYFNSRIWGRFPYSKISSP